MEEAGRAIDGVPSSSAPDSNLGGDAEGKSPGGDHRQNNYDRRKRKADFADASMHYGCRGGRDGGRGDKKRRKKRDVGRGEYLYVTVHPSSNPFIALTLGYTAGTD